MAKRIVLIIAIVAVALALTGNSLGWLNRTELSRKEYFASFAQEYREQGKDDAGNTKVIVSAPDFSRLQNETEDPIADMNVNDLQVLVSSHPAMKRDYAFGVSELTEEAVAEGFFRQLSLEYVYNAVESAKISDRWSDQKTESDEKALGEAAEVSIGASKKAAGSNLEEYLKWYRDGKAENLLVMPNNYSYWKVAKRLEPGTGERSCWQPVQELTGKQFALNEETYYGILLEEMILMDLDENKTEYASELTFDNLEAYVDSEFEKEAMRKDVVSRLAGRSPGMKELKDSLNSATKRIKKGTENAYQWAECMAAFEVMAETYADFDNLLTTIADNSEGMLAEQAETLKASVQKAMEIRLDTYDQFTNATRSDYDVRWFNAIFFDAAKDADDYKTDRAFRNMVLQSEELFGKVSMKQGMKKNVAALTDLPGADLDACMYAAQELVVQAQIDSVVQRSMLALIKKVGKQQANGELKKTAADAYIAYSKYLLFGRMHGEYLLYGLVNTNEDLREWFLESTGTDVVSWYDAKSANLMNMRSDLLQAHTSDLESYEGHSYLCVDVSKTWQEAKEFCESMGGHLACITSEGEQKFIHSVIKDGEMNQYWLGGYATDEYFEWISEEEFEYTNWDDGEPGGKGLLAGGKYIEILRVADPNRDDSRKYAWMLSPNDNTYYVEKPEILVKEEEEEAAREEAAREEAKRQEAEANGEETGENEEGTGETNEAGEGADTAGESTADGEEELTSEEREKQISELEEKLEKMLPENTDLKDKAVIEKLTPEQSKLLKKINKLKKKLKHSQQIEEAKEDYEKQLEAIAFYGEDNVGFICEWD